VREKIKDLALKERICRRASGRALHRHGKVLRVRGQVYRILKAYDLITSPAYVVIKAADEFQDKTTARTSSGRPTSPT
jgi:putative transposase